MIGSKTAPTELLINPNGSDNTKRRLVLRNSSNKDIAVKLVVPKNAKDSVSFSHHCLRLAAKAVLSVELTFDKMKMKKNKEPLMISGYATGVESYNLADLEPWLNKDGSERKHQLAFILKINVGPGFSAYETVIDLPASASLLSSVRHGTTGIDSSDTTTARPFALETEVLTARNFGSQENFVKELQASNIKPSAPPTKKAEKKEAKKAGGKEESCWIVSMVSSYLSADTAKHQPLPEKPKDKSSKKSSLKSNVSQKSVKARSKPADFSTKSFGSRKNSRKSRPSSKERRVTIKRIETEEGPNKKYLSESITTESEFINNEMNAAPCAGN